MLAGGPRTSFFVASVLTWTAGFVDAVGFLGAGRIYTANMSGNSVSLGIGLGEWSWLKAALRLWPIVMYVAGIFGCRLLIEIGRRLRFRRVASVAFLAEIALLISPLFMDSPANSQGLQQYAVIGLLALAMGVQNGALSHFNSLTLHTGFVTGTLVTMSEHGTRFLAWFYDRIRSGRIRPGALLVECLHEKSLRLGTFLAFIWSMYVAGAVIGAIAQSRWQFRSLLIAIGSLLLTTALDLYCPLAVREEQMQVSS